MDERKKTIRNLEEKKQETLHSLDLLAEDLGKKLLIRFDQEEGSTPYSVIPSSPREVDYITEYRHFLGEISDSEAFIAAVEADAQKLREIERRISEKEQGNAEIQRTLSRSYTQLGERIFEDETFAAFTAPYRKQMEILVPKIRSLETRLGELEDQGGANMLAWIGKSAQSMVIRSFLGKNQGNLQRVFTAAGEQFVRSGLHESVAEAESRRILLHIVELRQSGADLCAELGALKEEVRRITDSFGPEKSSALKKRNLERHVVHTREQLQGLFLRFGKASEAVLRQGGFPGDLEPDERLFWERIEELRQIVDGCEIQIGKLQASLEIDTEKREIERMERAIEDHRQRISVSEKTIADLSQNIEAAHLRISELESVYNVDSIDRLP